MKILLSQLEEKEIINLNNGERLGILANIDISLEKETGKIIDLLVPHMKFKLRLFGNEINTKIPWAAIKKIGNDMIIVELD